MQGDGIGWPPLRDWIDPFNWGALDDGIQDNTVAIQAAIDNGAHKIIYFPYRDTGVYMTGALTLISDIILFLAPGVEIKLIANSDIRLIECWDKSNVEIWGGIFNGDHANQTPTGQEHCLDFRGSTKVIVRGTKCINAGGDGLYIGPTGTQLFCEDMTIDSIVCDGNYRQGISLTSGKNINIINPILKNTSGTTPAAGIDIEPNTNADFLQGIKIENANTIDNDGIGIVVSVNQLDGSAVPHDITISNCTSLRDEIGFAMMRATGAMEVVVSFNNCKAIYSNKNGFLFRAQDAPRSEVHDCYSLNCGQSGAGATKYDSGFAIFDEAADGMTTMGNVHLYDCFAEDNDANMPCGFIVNKEAGTTVSNITMINCNAAGFTSAAAYSFHAVDFAKDTNVLEFWSAWDPADIAVGAEVAIDVACANTMMNDYAEVGFSLDLQDLTLTANVTAPGTITCVLANNTAGAVNLLNGNLWIKIISR